MNFESKSSNSDYGSFCATPPVGDGSGASLPLAAGKPVNPPYHTQRVNAPEAVDNSLISGVSLTHICKVFIIIKAGILFTPFICCANHGNINSPYLEARFGLILQMGVIYG